MKKKRHTNELYPTYEMHKKVNKQQTVGSKNGVSGVTEMEKVQGGLCVSSVVGETVCQILTATEGVWWGTLDPGPGLHQGL